MRVSRGGEVGGEWRALCLSRHRSLELNKRRGYQFIMGQRVAHARAHQQGRSYVTMVHANGEALNFELCSPTLPPPSSLPAYHLHAIPLVACLQPSHDRASFFLSLSFSLLNSNSSPPFRPRPCSPLHPLRLRYKGQIEF